jgi:hypothetical protein
MDPTLDRPAVRDRDRSRSHAFHGADWQLVGATLLLGALLNPGRQLEALFGGDYPSALRWLAGNELVGLLILGFGALLIHQRIMSMPRPVALAVALAAGSFVACAVTMAAYPFAELPGLRGGPHGYWTLVLFFTRQSMLPWGFAAAAWYFVERSTERRAALRASERARHRLEAQVAEARLVALQAQVEPHFLFNTLAHVKRLYRTDPARARGMLENFRHYLAASLPQMRAGGATLGSELQLACAYLEVQKIRMGERLAVEIAVPELDRARSFPPMMLISLVENAIKHGLNPVPEGGTIRIASESSPERLRVVVADSGRGLSETRGTGVGLANIHGRLAAMFGADATLDLAPNLPHGIRATIELPAQAPTQAVARR